MNLNDPYVLYPVLAALVAIVLLVCVAATKIAQPSHAKKAARQRLICGYAACQATGKVVDTLGRIRCKEHA